MNRSMKSAGTRPAQLDSVPQPAKEDRVKRVPRIRFIAVLTMTSALMLGALSFAGSAGAETINNASCQASGYAQIGSKCMQIKHTKTLGPAASAALNEALSTPAGQAALQ